MSQTSGAGHDPRPADSIPLRLVDAWLPPRLRPYARLARLDRPIGWWLLLLPCLWSSGLASASAGQMPDLIHFALFFIGAVVMRGAGSTWNDIVDRDLDGSVERTRNRPIPSGAVSAKQAALFMGLLLLTGLAILLTFNRTAILIGFASLVPVVIYPFIKRVSNHPQLVLGLAFAWGGLMGWVAETERLEAPAYLLYAAAIAWTVGYDTLYALQDIEDDPSVGIGSTALAYGDKVPAFVAAMYALAIVLAAGAVWMTAPGFLAVCGLIGFAGHLIWQVRSIRLDDPAHALMLFKSNRDAGLHLAVGFALEGVYRAF